LSYSPTTSNPIHSRAFPDPNKRHKHAKPAVNSVQGDFKMQTDKL